MEFSKKTMAFDMKFRDCELSWRSQDDPDSTTCLSACSLSDKYSYFVSFQMYKLAGYAALCF
jgi:hypothetical protein